MYLVKTPKFIQNLFPNFLWKIPTSEKVLYLTFDDGPIPQVTPWVLEQLRRFDAKATFFCVGENVKKHRHVFEQVIGQGHSVGNHTFNHINGWGADNINYFHNIRHCARLVNSSLFRPPYGRLMPKQTQFLQRHYRIVMWDVLSGDFDEQLNAEQCYNNVVKHATKGSIIVFHDSLKAQPRLKAVLPKVLAHFTEQGYRFESLSQEKLEKSTKLSKSA